MKIYVLLSDIAVESLTDSNGKSKRSIRNRNSQAKFISTSNRYRMSVMNVYIKRNITFESNCKNCKIQENRMSMIVSKCRNISCT